MAHRTFQDAFGRQWEVWEVHPAMAERRSGTEGKPAGPERRRHREPRARISDQLRHGWLAFECSAERRRLAPPPEGWTTAPEAKLVELVERATVSGKPRRLIE